MVQMDNRSAGTRLVFDDDVNLKFGKFVFFLFVHAAQQCGQRVFAFTLVSVFIAAVGQKIFDVFDDVFLNRFQKVADLFVPFVFVAQIVNRVFNRDFNELFAQQARFAALFVLPFGQVLRGVFNFFLHHVQVVDKRLFLVFRQFVKGFRTEYLAVFDRRDDQSDRHMQQRNAFAFCLFLQQADVFFLFLLIFFTDDAQSRLIFVAVQHGRNGRRKFFDEFVNVLGKFGSVAGGEGYGNRFVRFFKIVNVNPVLRGWTLFGFFD